jgi:conjugative transfer signal peptidase TraF
MKRHWFYFLPGMLLGLCSLCGGLAGYRFNLTSSMPLGIWKKSTASHRGGYAAVCLLPDSAASQMASERGYLPPGLCRGGLAPLLKRITAIPGDTVLLTDERVCVNDACLPNSRTLSNDSAGRPLIHYPHGSYRVSPGEYWLFSTNKERSFDSRYFGPVPESAVVSFLAPVATFNCQY